MLRSVQPPVAVHQEYIFVGDHNELVMLSGRTLRRMRTEKNLTSHAIVALHCEQNVLHVLDCMGNYFILNATTCAVTQSVSIASSLIEVSGGNLSGTSEPRRKSIAKVKKTEGGADISANAQLSQPIKQAYFVYSSRSGSDVSAATVLCALCMLPSGVIKAPLKTHQNNDDDNDVAATMLLPIQQGLSDCLFACGLRSGVVVLFQKGSKWLSFVNHHFQLRQGEKSTAAVTVGGKRMLPTGATNMTLSIAVQSVAVSPMDETVAIGGELGTLLVFPTLCDSHHFSDHWHHTPLSGISFSADGTTLFTGAAESVLLVWNLQNFSFHKIGCSSGGIHCIQSGGAAAPSSVIVCTGESAMVVVDLRKSSAVSRGDNVVLSSSWGGRKLATGMAPVGTWMGREVICPTGEQDILRVLDATSMQHVYSLHVGYQMETISSGVSTIEHTVMMDDGKVIIDYETSGASSTLPSRLRYWSYDAVSKTHVEQQSITAPHSGQRVVAMGMDERHHRVFTMSSDEIKCFGLVEGGTKSTLVNLGVTASPSRGVKSLAVTPDGSVLGVSDENKVSLYSAASIQPGVNWTMVKQLHQTVSNEPITHLHLGDPKGQFYFPVTAVSGNALLCWNILGASDDCTSFQFPNDVRILSKTENMADGEVFVSLSDGSIRRIKVTASSEGKRATNIILTEGVAVIAATSISTATVPIALRFLSSSKKLVVLDEERGFKVLSTAATTRGSEKEADTEELLLTAEQQEQQRSSRNTIGKYFGDVALSSSTRNDGGGANENDEDDDEDYSEGRMGERAAMIISRQKLPESLYGEAFACPPMSVVLDSYLLLDST